MERRWTVAQRSALLAMALGCQVGSGDRCESDGPVAEEEPLDLSVDRVDVTHGMLRVSATMRDGSADVSISLGGACEHREVGGGVSTRSSLVSTLDADELASALGCDLVVTARAVTPTGLVFKVARVQVVAELAPVVADDARPQPSILRSTTDVRLVFEGVGARERLSVDDSLIESSSTSSGVELATEFAVSHRDFARAVLSRRPIRLGVSSFDASLSIGGTDLEVEAIDAPGDGVQSAPPEPPSQE